MTVDISERIKLEDIISHPWLKKYVVTKTGEVSMNEVIVKNLQEFKGKSLLKRELISILVKQQSFS